LIPLNLHGPAILLRKLKRWFEPDLDPQRVAKVFDEFDRVRGFAAWQDYCRTRLTRAVPDDAAKTAIIEHGYATVPVMHADTAVELLQAVRRDEDIARLKRDSAKLEGYALTQTTLVERLLEASLNAAVDRQILSFFRSEYLVYWYTLSRTAPGNAPASVSFRWHCDKGPHAHLKLLIYLNDYSEHGGGTSYLDLAGSTAVARTGYLFARGRRRTESLAELAQLAGTALTAYDHHPTAGDAVLFQPARVLHSGITPTIGPRYVLTLCLLPSPVPWRAALARGAHIDLRTEPLWPADTRQLEKQLAGTNG
jgi:hypothetical protein